MDELIQALSDVSYAALSGGKCGPATVANLTVQIGLLVGQVNDALDGWATFMDNLSEIAAIDAAVHDYLTKQKAIVAAKKARLAAK